MQTEVARHWATRWDRQQERYIADREQRFTVCADLIDAVAARPGPAVVDLGCGPGSLLDRLAERLPRARLTGVDNDPLLLEIARRCCPAATLIDADLADATAWAGPAASPVDAVVSSTALHWLPVEDLVAVYAAAARLVRPGGLLINADHLFDAQPAVAALSAELRARREMRTGVVRHEDWASWWQAAGDDPDTACLARQRADRGVTGGWSNGLTVADHEQLLRAAGFREVGPVWQYGNDVVLVAVR
jgi:SAM-dependent methyltransferase